MRRPRPPSRALYRVGLPLALVAWLLPIIAVALTAIRGQGDIAQGNFFGWPSEWQLVENITSVFSNTPMAQYMLNSLLVTVPTVAGALALSCLAGFALGVYRFKANLLVFFLFVGGNFVPFQILMVPVRDLTLQLGFLRLHHRPGAVSTSPSRRGSAPSSCATSSATCRWS